MRSARLRRVTSTSGSSGMDVGRRGLGLLWFDEAISLCGRRRIAGLGPSRRLHKHAKAPRRADTRRRPGRPHRAGRRTFLPAPARARSMRAARKPRQVTRSCWTPRARRMIRRCTSARWRSPSRPGPATRPCRPRGPGSRLTPQSREANRYVLQILVALNRVADSADPLKTDLALADPKERNAVLAVIPRAYSRVSDKKARGHGGGAGPGRLPGPTGDGCAGLDRGGPHEDGRRRQRGGARRRAARPGRRAGRRRARPARAGIDGPEAAAGRTHRAPLHRRQAAAGAAHGVRPGPARCAALRRSRAATAGRHRGKARLPGGVAGAGHAAAAGQQGRRRGGLAQAIHRAGAGTAQRRGAQPRAGPGLYVACRGSPRSARTSRWRGRGWIESTTRRTWSPRRAGARRSWRARASSRKAASCCAPCPSAAPTMRA